MENIAEDPASLHGYEKSIADIAFNHYPYVIDTTQ